LTQVVQVVGISSKGLMAGIMIESFEALAMQG
jgi:hypothetical protein